jgi:hypothetical protein
LRPTQAKKKKKKQDPISKVPTQEGAGRVAQVVECLPSKDEAEFKPHYALPTKRLKSPLNETHVRMLLKLRQQVQIRL